MILATYISDLLYRYDCVIVPNFGGFVSNTINARKSSSEHKFYPPTKQITFNSLLKHNDGLLANYIASAENISFEKASSIISLAVLKWQSEIQTNPITIDGLGSLSLNEKNKIIFNPETSINYLTASFGLSPLESPSIKRYKEKVIPLVNTKEKDKKKGIPVFIKYAATAAILLSLSFAGYTGYQNNHQKEVLANQQKSLEKKIQSATFVISNPLPTIELNVVKATPKLYHLIAGAFRFEENAKKKVAQIKKRGYAGKIIGKNKNGLFLVAYDSFSSIEKARTELDIIKRILFDYNSWILVKKFN